MGYYNQPAAKLPPAKLTPLEQALASIKCPDTLAVLGKLVYNTAVAPKDPKFRRVKLSNAKIAATIGSQPDALKALELFGWRPVDAAAAAAATEPSETSGGSGGGAATAGDLELPESVTLTMAQHRTILAAQDALASASLRRNFNAPGAAGSGAGSRNSSAGNLAALQQPQQP